MDIETAREELRGMLASSVRRGTVRLASGKMSDFYIDGKLTTCRGRGAYLTAELILHRLAGLGVQAIGGLTMGADPIASATAALAAARGIELDAFLVRKEPKPHGTSKWIEGPPPGAGSRVVFVDDVITTGGSTLKAIDRVREEADVEIVMSLAIVDRGEGAAENFAERGIPFASIFTRADLER